MASAPFPDTELLKPLSFVISWVLRAPRASFVLMCGPWPQLLTRAPDWLGVSLVIAGSSVPMRCWAPGWGLVTRKIRPWLQSWNFEPYPPFSREEKEARNRGHDQSCLCNQASIRILKVQPSENFWVGEHMEVQGSGTQEGIEAPSPFPHPCPTQLSSVSFITFFYSKLVNISKLLSWVPWAALANQSNPRKVRGNSL